MVPAGPAPAASAPASSWVDAARRTVVGRSVEGRPLTVLRRSGAEAPVRQRLLVIGSMPTLNPDGLAASRRTNAHGVDLNRNFPHAWAPGGRGTRKYAGPRAASEPETRAAMSLLEEVRPDLVVSFHQPLYGVDSYGAKRRAVVDTLARHLALPVRRFACWSVCRGTLTGWFNQSLPGTAVTVELVRSASAAQLDRVARGLLRTTQDAAVRQTRRAGSAQQGEATPVPAAVAGLPAGTRQAVRVTRSRRWCAEVHCAKAEAWERDDTGEWRRLRIAGGDVEVRAQVGPRGFASPARKREGDGHTPTGAYRIVTTFSIDRSSPGWRMPWRPRTATSVVPGWPGRDYNTWLELPGRTAGDRPTMRAGLWVDYNNARLRRGVGPAPVPGRGSGIFVHTVNPGQPFAPTQGCAALPLEQLRWLLGWLDPTAQPRVVLGS